MLLNCLFLLFLGYCARADSEGYPIASDDVEGTPECGPCQQYKKSKFGELKCVAIPYCCPGKASAVRCLLDPCVFFRATCTRARYCVPQNCNGGCSPIYYDSHLDPINVSECTRAVFPKSKSSNRLRIEKPRKGVVEFKSPDVDVDVPENLVSPSGVKYPKERKIKENGGFKKQILLWPSHIGINSSEKPGKCPSDENTDIIKVCTSDCSLDDHCFGKKKCCWNGCSYRCTVPQRHDPENFLNYPIFWKL